MSRRVSFNQRLANDFESTAEIFAALFFIEHPELPEPIRLSTDNTERLSDDPLMYGTRSTWLTANPIANPFLFVIASAILPSDQEDAAPEARVALDNLDSEIARVLRSFTTMATVHMAVILASSPNVIELEQRDFALLSADIDSGEISLVLSRDDIEEEQYPVDTMSRDKYPGLHR